MRRNEIIPVVEDDRSARYRSFSAAQMRQDYQAQPAQLQQQTRERILALLAEERREFAAGRRCQHSALWRLAGPVYGIDPGPCPAPEVRVLGGLEAGY